MSLSENLNWAIPEKNQTGGLRRGHGILQGVEKRA